MRAVVVAGTVAIVVVGCGKNNPSGPSNSTPAGAVANTFIGVVSATGGAGGTVQLRAASSLSSLAPGGRKTLFARVLSLVEPIVLAQSSTASGIFIGESGQVATLAGSFSGNTFSVSGGGYSVTATVTGTSLTGSASLPGGQSATVTASPPVSAPNPPPAVATGFYDGSYQIVADATYRNTLPSDGSLLIQCTYQAVAVGNLTLQITNRSNGDVDAELSYSWTESEGARTCPFVVIASPISPGPGVMHYQGPPTTLTFGRVDQGPNGTGTVVRSETFVGAVSGNTVVGRVSRSFQFTNSIASPPRNHLSWYPAASTNVVLVKR
jgi:hypothetical protein